MRSGFSSSLKALFILGFFSMSAIPSRAQLPAGSAGGASSSGGGAQSNAGGGQVNSPVQGNYSGSVPSNPVPGVLSLSLQDAINRGLKQNLGMLLSSADVTSARGQRWEQLSQLLP